jgi:hypothetical protein
VSIVRGKHSLKWFRIAERNLRSVCCPDEISEATPDLALLHWPLSQVHGKRGEFMLRSGEDSVPHESEFPVHAKCGRCGNPIEALFDDRNRYGSLIWRTPEYIIEEVPW